MQQLLNTLFVTTQGAYVRVDHDTLKVEVDGEVRLQVPVHHLGGVVLFGNVMVSPFALHRCAEDGRMVALFDRNGRFKARIVGPTSGNVLLRCAQHEALGSPDRTLAVARNMVAGKLQNSRRVLLRAAREAEGAGHSVPLRESARQMNALLQSLEECGTVDEVRGAEGRGAKLYFSVFDDMIRTNRDAFRFIVRSRRPPKDRINALLSFLYALLANDYVSACEGVGLDPQVGYLHALRPGRPALALDLMEELRSFLADRLAVTLVNRKQLQPNDFVDRPGGSVLLKDDPRKRLLVEYQKRKQEELMHPLLERRVPLGLVPHVQARLLARHLRGDSQAYVPFVPR